MNRKEDAMNMTKMVSALLISLAVFFLVGGGFVSAASAADCSSLRCNEGSPSWDENWDAEITSITASPSTIQSGEQLNVDIHIKNTGPKTGTFHILLCIRKPNGDVIHADEKLIRDLPSMKTKTVCLSYTVPDISGGYRFSVKVIDFPLRDHLFDCECASFWVSRVHTPTPTPAATSIATATPEELPEIVLSTGESFDLGDGYSLMAGQIDLEGGKVWLSLSRYDKQVGDWVLRAGETFTYTVLPKLPSSEHNSQPRHHPATITSRTSTETISNPLT